MVLPKSSGSTTHPQDIKYVQDRLGQPPEGTATVVVCSTIVEPVNPSDPQFIFTYNSPYPQRQTPSA